MSILGGYPEGGGTASQRNPDANTTVLSGDLGAPGSAADNAYHVVTARGADRTAALDGFTVSGGNADATGEIVGDRWLGGGMYNTGASPTLTRCTFRENWAGYGGGMANYAGSSPRWLTATSPTIPPPTAPGCITPAVRSPP